MSKASNVGSYYERKCILYEDILFDVLELIEREDVIDLLEMESLGHRIRRHMRRSEANLQRLKTMKAET